MADVSERMWDGVRMVKMGLYRRLRVKLAPAHGEDAAGFLAAAVVNELFSEDPTDETAKAFLEANRPLVAAQIEALRADDEIRLVVTQAARVKAAIAQDDTPLETLANLGLLLPGGRGPTPGAFLLMAADFLIASDVESGPEPAPATESQDEGTGALTFDEARQGAVATISYLIEYCIAYLTARRGLTAAQAQLLILDPEFGTAVDQAKAKWLFDDLPLEVDEDELLVARDYDAAEMRRINDVLDTFASEYAAREPAILDYLRSVGHPLGAPPAQKSAGSPHTESATVGGQPQVYQCPCGQRYSLAHRKPGEVANIVCRFCGTKGTVRVSADRHQRSDGPCEPEAEPDAKGKSQDEGTGALTFDEGADLLIKRVVGAARQCAEHVHHAAGDYQDEIDSIADAQIMFHFEFFLLHLVSRRAYSILEVPEGARLMNHLANVVIGGTVQVLYGEADEETRDNVGRSLWDDLQKAELHFSTCKKLLWEEGEPARGTLCWEFGKMLAQLLPEAHRPDYTMLGTELAVHCYTGLRAQEVIERIVW